MPLVIHPRVRKTVGRVAVLTCAALFATTGAAFASCSIPQLSTPFAQFGDNNVYFSVPGGTFEGSAATVGWTLNNAELTAGGEPFDVDGGSDDQVLTINAGGSATSPYFCLDKSMPDFRFLAQETAPGSDLQVQGLVQTPYGLMTVPVADIPDGSMTSWAPTQPISIQTAQLPSWLQIPVAVRFVVPGSSGSWQVDDVYVDPFRAG